MKKGALSKFTDNKVSTDHLNAKRKIAKDVSVSLPSSAYNNFVNYSLPRRRLAVDDILWCSTFAVTCWYFDFPIQLFIHPWVDRRFLKLSVLFIMITIMLTVIMFLGVRNKYPPGQYFARRPLFYSFTWLSLFLSYAMFCLAAWKLWNVWTLYISFVTFMFSLACFSLL